MQRFALLLPLLLVGCVSGRFSEGEPFKQKQLDQLEPGKTTAAQVTEILGPPRHVVELDKRSAYLYEFSRTRTAGLVLVVANFVNVDERFDRIWLFFDEGNVMTHYGAKLSSHRVRLAMPWKDLHRPDRNAKRDEERRQEEAEQAG